MPYPHYTEEEKQNVYKKGADVKNIPLLWPRYWWAVSKVFQEKYPCFGENNSSVKELSQLIISGKLRNGNGEKLPADWTDEDFCCYMYEKEQAREAERINKKTAESLAEMGMNVPTEEQPVQQKAEPDFLLYDDAKKCFIEFNIKNFYTKDPSELNEVGEIDVSMEFPAEPEKKDDPRATALKSQLISSVVADAAAAITELVRDLQKRDSIFSSNSKEYKDFYNGLKALRNKLADENGQPRPFNSLEELGNCFNDPDNKVFDMAGTYLKTKMRQKNGLSDRQIDRMSMCRRFRSIEKAVDKAIKEAQEGKLPDCRAEIVNATAAHKAVLGLMRGAGPAAESKAFRNDAVYTAQFERAKEIFEKSEQPFKAAKYAKSSPAQVAKSLAPDKIQKNVTHTDEDYREAMDKIAARGPSNSKLVVIAEFLMQRTHGMLEELKANDSFWHSDEQKQFRIGVENLHDALIGIAADDESMHTKHNLDVALENVSKLAEAYQVRHVGDSAENSNIKTVRRLGVAAEIRICQEYLASHDSDNVNPTELFNRVIAHQALMRTLERDHELYADDSLRYAFQPESTFSKTEIDDYKRFERTYTREFNQLINAAGYNKIIDINVDINAQSQNVDINAQSQEESKKEESDAILAIAVSRNEPIDKIKFDIEAGRIPNPTKTTTAPKADKVTETTEPQRGGMEERLIK